MNNSNAFLIVGDLNLDIISHLEEDHFLNKRDYEHIIKTTQITLGGSAGIIAHNLSQLTNNLVSLYSSIGNDDHGRILNEILSKKVDRSLIYVDPSANTGASYYFSPKKGHNVLFTDFGATLSLHKFATSFDIYSTIHISSIDVISQNTSLISQLLKKFNKPENLVSINFNRIVLNVDSKIIDLLDQIRARYIIYFNEAEYLNFTKNYPSLSGATKPIYVITFSHKGCIVHDSESFFAIKIINGIEKKIIGAGDILCAHVMHNINNAPWNIDSLKQIISSFIENGVLLENTKELITSSRLFLSIERAISYIRE